MTELTAPAVHKSFLRVASIAAILTAFTTIVLWLFPKLHNAPSTFEEAVTLRHNAFYISRLWVNFLHIPLALAGYFGLMFVLYRKQLAWVLFGTFWFAVWGVVEMTGVAILLFTVNFTWRDQYAAADEATKAVLKANIDGFLQIWDSLFFVLLIAFLLATTCFAIAMNKSRGLEKLVGRLFWLAVPLTLLIILANYFNQTWASNVTNFIYPALQPISRFILGIYLWKAAASVNVKT